LRDPGKSGHADHQKNYKHHNRRTLAIHPISLRKNRRYPSSSLLSPADCTQLHRELASTSFNGVLDHMPRIPPVTIALLRDQRANQKWLDSQPVGQPVFRPSDKRSSAFCSQSAIADRIFGGNAVLRSHGTHACEDDGCCASVTASR
jgi:hypothetical protein